jgi:hypothetical protein
MAQWGSSDATSNAVLWAPAKYNLAPNSANRDALYTNSTADAFVTGQTIGMYGVDQTEIGIGAKALSAAALNGPGTGGNYIPGEIMTINNTGATYSASSTVAVVTTEVRTAAVVVGGTGYANGDTVRLNTGAGNQGIFTVTTGAADTIVASVALTNRGAFTTNPTLTAGATTKLTGSGTGLTLTVTTRIKTLGIAEPGDYSVAPTSLTGVALSGSATGTGATADLTYATQSKGITHTGWVVRTVGSGGRAGRVQNEVLVAGGIITDGSDDTVYPDA